MSEPINIAFLGLGVMGGPIAGHLARAGHSVTVYNRTAAKASAWLDRHQRDGLAVAMAETPADAARGKDVVLSCVGNDADLAEVLFGAQGAVAELCPGALFIDHTTVSPETARQVAKATSARGVLAVDAPVSGGQSGAEAGALSIMCGGKDDALAAARPIMDAYAARIVHVGGPGAGQGAKAVNQICIAGILGGLAEGLRFAQQAGLDTDKVFEAVSGGAAQSWQMVNRWDTMTRNEFDFGFAIDWMRKDLDIALTEARAHGISLPVTALVDQFYASVQAKGGGRQDTSALIRHLPDGSST
ncbi:NAD-binding protein [Altererythrobacter xixiisoli]|uniref:NAD-binding protein n=1 Tax=Croceibacterium xixiisoli TaxID=1476466 RepID=A0A6I4TQM3_9SPHN|nr:NAD(P)-dependent oxidoreductase [Croceibacterium xixiisoli]MXO98164.1 NAD-binding protein [Croceibacterium xixiisoli]